MLADVRGEVMEHFSFPKDAAKMKKTRVASKEGDTGEEDESDEDEEEAAAEDMDE